MTHFQSFGSFEEMAQAMTDQHQLAMDSLQPEQVALLEKTHFFWMRPAPECDAMIFGEYDYEASAAKERELWDDEDGPFEGWLERFRINNMVRGYKFGRAYSVFEPDGELGDTHVGNMYEISKEAFEEAKEHGWDHRKALTFGPHLHAAVTYYAQLERQRSPRIRRDV